MRIGIDARMLGNGFGIGRYVEQLLYGLDRYGTAHDYVVFLRSDNIEKFSPHHADMQKVEVDIPWYGWEEQIKLTSILYKHQVDFVHVPHWNVPLNYQKKFIVTIHDLIMYHYPRPEASSRNVLVHKIKDIAHRRVVSHAVNASSHIITTSHFTSQDIHDTLGVDMDKMTAIYQAPFIELLKTHEDEHLVLSKYGIQKKYILYVGACYPHKNVETLLRAWQIFCETQGAEYELVLVGTKNYFYDRLCSSETYGDTPHVIYTGHVSDDELKMLYAQTQLYVFPSLYEGYGLPPLEAIASHVPVVSSHASCLPEVLGEAALYFDPGSPEHIAQTIAQVLGDRDLQMKLLQNGRELLRHISHERFVRETIQVYEKYGSV